MLKKTIVFSMSSFFLIIATVLISPASENKGAPQITLNGGRKGAVSFPHLRHQNKLGNCQVCHDLFPKTKGSIDAMKSDGRLKSKQVMNTCCIKCHRTEKRAGRAAGPTSCSQCHQKT